MKPSCTSTNITLALFGILAVYAVGYFASVTAVQVSYGNPTGSRVAFYAHPWQQTFFNPVEQFDRWLFPARWRYDQLQRTDTATPPA